MIDIKAYLILCFCQLSINFKHLRTVLHECPLLCHFMQRLDGTSEYRPLHGDIGLIRRHRSTLFFSEILLLSKARQVKLRDSRCPF